MCYMFSTFPFPILLNKEYKVDETCSSPLHYFLNEVNSFQIVYQKSTGSV